MYGTTFSGGTHGGGTIFVIKEDGSGFRVLYHFGAIPNDGTGPYGDLVFGRDGALYGTTQNGGINNGAGTMFRIKTDGSGYQVLFHFTANNGYGPRGHLQEGDDGAFYGTTQFGGSGGSIGGVVYKINQDGTGFSVLHRLRSIANDGFNPDTGLTLGTDGMLYGVASGGGLYNNGTLFRIAQNGSGYTNLHHFRGPDAGDGREPDGRPLELADGMLYGTTGGSGFAPPGTIYRINKDGTSYALLRMFDTSLGEPGAVTSEVIQGTDGALYSTGSDTVFKIQPDGLGLQVLHRFSLAEPAGGFLARGLVLGTSGALFGVTSSRGIGFPGDGTVFRVNQDGTGFTVLHRFEHRTNFMRLPRAPLIRGNDGLFYGTTELSGYGTTTNGGCIFSVQTNASRMRILLLFGQGTNTARTPNGLLQGSDGWLYGTTQHGGALNAGVIFRIGLSGSNFGILRHMGGTGQPHTPRGALLEGDDGWLYGTSFTGGPNGRGSVFRIQKDNGQLEVLHSFGSITADGTSPHGDLVQAPDGALYGTTSVGGSANLGTIYRIYSDGSGYTNLHHFTGGSAGQNPQAGLMLGSDQQLYGTSARILGAFAGVVFSISLDGTGYQVLRAFPNTGGEPRAPRSPLVEGIDGLLYGSTVAGGTFNNGTLFCINRDGADFRVLHHFGSSPDGRTPSASFTALGDGSFLGVTEAGGGGNGTIFRFDPEETQLRIARSGSQADILWNRSSTSDTLEATTNLGAPDWAPFEGVVSEQADESRALISFDSPPAFFRIRREWR